VSAKSFAPPPPSLLPPHRRTKLKSLPENPASIAAICGALPEIELCVFWLMAQEVLGNSSKLLAHVSARWQR
jgi:hypothetical protein